MYAAVQALFCMTAWVSTFGFSDINIISISVQRFSEILRAGVIIGGSSWPKHFQFSGENLLGRCLLLLKRYLIKSMVGKAINHQ